MNPNDRIGCEEALRRLADYLDRELAPEEAEDVERHLETCRSCYSRAEFERRLKDRLRDELSVRDLPAEFERRMRGLLESLPEEA